MALGDVVYLTGQSCYLILENEAGEWFFVHRANTGYQDGKWGLPGGHVKENEPMHIAAAREALEEVGVEVDPDDIKLVFVMQRNKVTESIDDRVDFYFKASSWKGTPHNAEPAIHDDARWLSPSDSSEPFMDFIGASAKHILSDKQFATFGWDEPQV